MPQKTEFCKYLQGAGLDFCNITLPLEFHLQSMPLSVDTLYSTRVHTKRNGHAAHTLNLCYESLYMCVSIDYVT